MVRQSLGLPFPERLFLNCGFLPACGLLSGSHFEIYVPWYIRQGNPLLATNHLSSLADNSSLMATKTIARTVDLESVINHFVKIF
jgi:hypothetical protein